MFGKSRKRFHGVSFMFVLCLGKGEKGFLGLVYTVSWGRGRKRFLGLRFRFRFGKRREKNFLWS